MRYLTLSIALGCLLATANSGHAQTAEVQNKVNDAVRKEKAKAIEAQKNAKEIQKIEGFEFVIQTHVTKGTLEDILAQALNNNPDIRVAEAKMREAEAEFNRVKLQVTQKVVAQQREIEACKDALKYAQANYDRMQALLRTGAGTAEGIGSAEAKLQQAKAELARAEADLPYLLGSPFQATLSLEYWKLRTPRMEEALDPKTNEEIRETLKRAFPKSNVPIQEPKHKWIVQEHILAPGEFGLANRIDSRHAPIPEGMATKIHTALDKPVHVDFNQVPLKDILDFLQQAVGFNVVNQIHFDNVRINLRLTDPVPLGAIFQCLEDQHEWRFVVREYGIVAAHAGHVPPGAISLQAFWKDRPAQAMTSPTSGQKK